MLVCNCMHGDTIMCVQSVLAVNRFTTGGWEPMNHKALGVRDIWVQLFYIYIYIYYIWYVNGTLIRGLKDKRPFHERTLNQCRCEG